MSLLADCRSIDHIGRLCNTVLGRSLLKPHVNLAQQEQLPPSAEVENRKKHRKEGKHRWDDHQLIGAATV